MDPLRHLNDSQHFALLGHPQRLAMLRRLMGGPATLTDLAEVLDSYPAKIRHHLKQLEQAGLVALTETRPVRGFVAKYYQATTQALYVNMTIVPDPTQGGLLLMGSHDPALEELVRQAGQRQHELALTTVAVGSLDGLIALRQGACHLAGCHLLDEASGEYNRVHVGQLFPGRAMSLITLAARQQGLLLPPGNPQGVRGLADLARPEVTFVNRQAGSGTRLWLDRELARLVLPRDRVSGYGREVYTHQAVGQMVAAGQAGAGLAVLTVARELGLDFLPLFEERYDLVFPAEAVEGDLRPLLDYLQTAAFRRHLRGFPGYDSAVSGEVQTVGP